MTATQWVLLILAIVLAVAILLASIGPLLASKTERQRVLEVDGPVDDVWKSVHGRTPATVSSEVEPGTRRRLVRVFRQRATHTIDFEVRLEPLGDGATRVSMVEVREAPNPLLRVLSRVPTSTEIDRCSKEMMRRFGGRSVDTPQTRTA